MLAAGHSRRKTVPTAAHKPELMYPDLDLRDHAYEKHVKPDTHLFTVDDITCPLGQRGLRRRQKKTAQTTWRLAGDSTILQSSHNKLGSAVCVSNEVSYRFLHHSRVSHGRGVEFSRDTPRTQRPIRDDSFFFRLVF